MIFQKYYSLDFVMKRRLQHLNRLLLEGLKKQKEEQAYQLYLTVRPNMTEKTYQTFEEFYNPSATAVPEETKTSEEILEEVKELLDTNKWG